MKNKNIGLISVHSAVLLFGLSGLFAKFINLPSITITLGRVFFSSIFLFLFLGINKTSINLKNKKDYLLLAVSGCILAVHWWSFLQSIQVSTVAIGTISFSSFPLFVTLIDPFFSKERLKFRNLACSLIMLLGIAVMVESWSLGNSATLGVMWGLLSAVTYGILSLINKRFSCEYSPFVISFYEQSAAFIFLLPSLFIFMPKVWLKDLSLLCLLGVVFTGISHSLFIKGLKFIKPQTAGIISGLEPIYSIAFAFLVFGEIPGIREVMGGIIILGVVFYTTFKEAI